MEDGNGKAGGMTAEEQKLFLDRADRFLAVANGMAGEDVPLGQISAAMMFACARFNAFFAQTTGIEPGDVDEEAVEFFREKYEKALRENLGQVLSSRAIRGG